MAISIVTLRPKSASWNPSKLGSAQVAIFMPRLARKVVTQNAAKMPGDGTLNGPVLSDTNKFSLSFWRKPYQFSGANLPPDCAFMGDVIYPNANGFFVCSDDGTYNGRGCRVWLPLASGWGGSTVNAQCDTPGGAGALPWSHCVIVYDGTQADNATRLKFYLDGSARTLTFTGTVPATLTMGSAAFKIGQLPGTGIYDNCIHAFNRIGYWAATALTSGNVTTLYNSTAGKTYSEMSAGEKTGLTHFWDCSEAASTRFASVGTNLTDAGNVDSVALLKSFQDYSGTYTLQPLGFSSAHTYTATGCSGGPGWVDDNRYCISKCAFTSSKTAGNVFMLGRQHAWISSNFDKAWWGYGDTNTATEYFFGQTFNTPSSTIIRKLRCRRDASSFNTTMSAGTYTADTMEWQEWAVQAGSTAMRVNGSTQSVTDDGTGGNGKWFNSFPGGDTLTYGGFSGGGTYQGYGLGVMGPLAIVGTITAAQRAKLTAYLKQGYSAALS